MTRPLLLSRDQIEDTRWNAHINTSKYPVIYAYTWYLDIVSPQWQALVWPSAQNYEIVMPLPIRKKWGFKVMQQPLFCQYLGLFSQTEISEATLSLFLNGLSTQYYYISVYNFHPWHTPLLQKLKAENPELKVQEKTTHWLDIEKPYDALYEGYTNDRKLNLKRSRKYHWNYFESNDIQPLLALFRQNHASKIEGIKNSAYELLESLTAILLKKEKCKIQYAALADSIHAGILIVENREMGIYIFNAADVVGREGNARTFLLDRYFKDSADRIRLFDFESPEVPGIAKYYASFGGDERIYISIKKNKLPFPFRQLVEWRKRWLTTS